MSIWTTVLPQWLAAVGGASGVGALVHVRTSRRAMKAQTNQYEADAAHAVTDGAVMLLEPLTLELAKTRAEAAGLRADVATLREYVCQLMEIIKEAGLQVPPGPNTGGSRS